MTQGLPSAAPRGGEMKMTELPSNEILALITVVVIVGGFFASFAWRLFVAGNARDRQDRRGM
jgi:hypothetical protein